MRGTFEDVPLAGNGPCVLGALFVACGLAVDGARGGYQEDSGSGTRGPAARFFMSIGAEPCFGPHVRVFSSALAISGKKGQKCAMGGRGFDMYKALRGAQGFMRNMNAVHI